MRGATPTNLSLRRALIVPLVFDRADDLVLNRFPPLPGGGRVAAAPPLEGHQMRLCPVGLEADSELLCVRSNCTAGGKFCYTDRMCVVRLDSEPCFSSKQNKKYRLPDRRGLEIENRPPNAILARAGAVFRVHRMGAGAGGLGLGGWGWVLLFGRA